jgi:hypothetical protein
MALAAARVSVGSWRRWVMESILRTRDGRKGPKVRNPGRRS